MRNTVKQAWIDADEYACAKMYYGEGAGNRRKRIRAIVDERSKDPVYKREFDKAMREQNWEAQAKKARRERNVNDVKKNVYKGARGVFNGINGRAVGSSIAAGVLVYILKVTGYDRKIKEYATNIFGGGMNEFYF